MTEALELAFAAEGDPILKVGAVLSIVKVVDGPAPAAVFPAASEAVAEAKVIPTVPSPVHEDRDTVRVAVPVPLTTTVQSAVPVLLSVMSLEAAVTAVAPE